MNYVKQNKLQIMSKVKKWESFLNNDFTENQKVLRSYIKLIKTNYDIGIVKDEGGDYNKYDIYLNYFTIIHNFLYLENEYYDVVKLVDKEINKYLNLPRLTTLEDVSNKFIELYDVNNKVRFSIETFDSIEEIRILLKKLPNDFYRKIYKSFNIN